MLAPRLAAAAALAVLPLAAAATLSSPASAAAKKPVVYQNCTALVKHYAHGVAKSGYRERGGGLHGHKPYVNTALYNANKKSDRDKDGVACER